MILAKTIKGYGLGEGGEGRNVTHQQKKLNEEELREFRTPLRHSDLRRRRGQGAVLSPGRRQRRRCSICASAARRSAASCRGRPIVPLPLQDAAARRLPGRSSRSSGDREVSTTMAFVGVLSKLLKDKKIGKYIVPIVPDESRTFGMDGLFRQFGIYSHAGQLYEPVDSDQLLYYREAKDGQLLEEGITEAGSMSSFIAAGTAYSTHGINMIPFFIYYSMFGFQRIGDLIWAAADCAGQGLHARRHRRPHDAHRRRAAASGRPQPA